MKRLLLFVAAFALTSAVVAKADQTIYYNGGPNGLSGNEMTEWIQTEEFTLPTAATLNDIHFWDVGFAGSYAGSTTWIIYSDNGGNPGGVVATGSGDYARTDTGVSLYFGEEFLNDITGLNVSLLGGVEYHLGLHNGPLAHNSRDNLYWETTSFFDGVTAREWNLQLGGPWSDNLQEHAFSLTGTTTPEPSSLMLLGTGLMGLAGGVFRKLRS